MVYSKHENIWRAKNRRKLPLSRNFAAAARFSQLRVRQRRLSVPPELRPDRQEPFPIRLHDYDLHHVHVSCFGYNYVSLS